VKGEKKSRDIMTESLIDINHNENDASIEFKRLKNHKNKEKNEVVVDMK
jgi:hypothetical protein